MSDTKSTIDDVYLALMHERGLREDLEKQNAKLKKAMKQAVKYIDELAEPELHPGYKIYYDFIMKWR